MPVIREVTLNKNNGLNDEPLSAPPSPPLEPSDLTNSFAHRDDAARTRRPHVQSHTARATKFRRAASGSVQDEYQEDCRPPLDEPPPSMTRPPMEQSWPSTRPTMVNPASPVAIHYEVSCDLSAVWGEDDPCDRRRHPNNTGLMSNTTGNRDSMDFEDYQFDVGQYDADETHGIGHAPSTSMCSTHVHNLEDDAEKKSPTRTACTPKECNDASGAAVEQSDNDVHHPGVPTSSQAERDGYHLHLHIDTSADEQDDLRNESLHPVFGSGSLYLRQVSLPPSPSTCSSASGMTTPPRRPCSLEALLREVELHLASMVMQGDDLLAQMHGQEFARWAANFQDEPLATYGRMLANAGREYVVPGFEVGIVYPPAEGQWIASVLARVRHLSLQPRGEGDAPAEDQTPEEPDDNEGDDAVSLMGGRHDLVRNTGGSRCTDRSPERTRCRSRSRPRNERQRREGPERSSRDDRAERGEHIRASRSSAAASSRHAPPDREAEEPSHRNERFTQSTRRLVPPRASRTEAEQSGLSTRQQALSFNRLTWRTLLGVEDDGPCQDIHRWVPQPLDEIQADNIAATVQDLGDAERLAMTTGFFRYLLELAHQTMQILVTGNPGDPTRQFNHEEFDEDIVLVQTEVKMVQRAREQFGEAQAALETCAGNRRYRAAWLKNMLESRYLGILEYELWHSSIQELHSMLVVLADDYDLMTCVDVQPEDKDFAETWWKKVRRCVLQIDHANPMLHGTNLVRSRSTSPDQVVVDLDTPPVGNPRAEDDAHDLQVHLEQIQNEDEYIEQLCRQAAQHEQHEEQRMIQIAHEQEQQQRAIAAARQYQQWEDWVMQGALQEPSRKRARCAILLSASTQSSSSSARLHLDLPQPGERIAINIVVHAEAEEGDARMAPVTPSRTNVPVNTVNEGLHITGDRNRSDCDPSATLVDDGEDQYVAPAEGDSTSMMQTTRSDTTPARALLRSLSPQLRQQVAQQLRGNVGRLQQALRDQIQALDDCMEGAPIMDLAQTSAPEAPMLEGLAGVLQALLEQQLGQNPMAPHSVVMQCNTGISANVPRPHATELAVPAPGGLDAANSSVSGDAGSRLNTTCDTLDHRLDLLLLDANPEQRHAILRGLMHRLLTYLHGNSCRLRIALQLLARRLPQPTLLEGIDTSVDVQADQLFDDLVQQLDRLMANVAELSAEIPMGQEWAVQQLPLLGAFALDCMGFLECGEYDSSHPDDAETQSVESHESYVPGFDRMRNQPDFRDEMITKKPDASREHETARGSTTTPTTTTRGRKGPRRDDHDSDDADRRTEDTQQYATTTRSTPRLRTNPRKPRDDKKGKRVKKGMKKTVTEGLQGIKDDKGPHKGDDGEPRRIQKGLADYIK